MEAGLPVVEGFKLVRGAPWQIVINFGQFDM